MGRFGLAKQHSEATSHQPIYHHRQVEELPSSRLCYWLAISATMATSILLELKHFSILRGVVVVVVVAIYNVKKVCGVIVE
jgi:hypothetical protein